MIFTNIKSVYVSVHITYWLYEPLCEISSFGVQLVGQDKMRPVVDLSWLEWVLWDPFSVSTLHWVRWEWHLAVKRHASVVTSGSLLGSSEIVSNYRKRSVEEKLKVVVVEAATACWCLCLCDGVWWHQFCSWWTMLHLLVMESLPS